MSDAFSTPATHAFAHPELEDVRLEAGPSSMGDANSLLSIEEAFEVEDTIRRIIDGGYKTVSKLPYSSSTPRCGSREREADEQIGLQFPDELLPSSVPVFRAIQKGIAPTGAQSYVLADSTYGRCVDFGDSQRWLTKQLLSRRAELHAPPSGSPGALWTRVPHPVRLIYRTHHSSPL